MCPFEHQPKAKPKWFSLTLEGNGGYDGGTKRNCGIRQRAWKRKRTLEKNIAHVIEKTELSRYPLNDEETREWVSVIIKNQQKHNSGIFLKETVKAISFTSHTFRFARRMQWGTYLLLEEHVKQLIRTMVDKMNLVWMSKRENWPSV